MVISKVYAPPLCSYTTIISTNVNLNLKCKHYLNCEKGIFFLPYSGLNVYSFTKHESCFLADTVHHRCMQ